MQPKIKGNTEERKQAKQLSLWMFNDPDVLKKHPTSGTDKSVYSGDIIPLKQLEPYGWKEFKIFIEIKSGYEDAIPTPYIKDKVESWFRKAIKQSKNTGQDIIFLICQFKYRKALLITDLNLSEKIMFNMCIPVYIDESTGQFAYIYFLSDILKFNFEELFEGIDYKGVNNEL